MKDGLLLCCTDVHVGRCSCLLNESWPFEGTSGWSVTLSVVRLCCTDVHVGRCSCLLNESWPFEGTSGWSITLSFQLYLQRLEYISITYSFVRVVNTFVSDSDTLNTLKHIVNTSHDSCLRLVDVLCIKLEYLSWKSKSQWRMLVIFGILTVH